MASHQVPVYFVNAFNKKPFSGNPAAICLLQDLNDVTDTTKQRLAAEFNLPCTAFAAPTEIGKDFITGSKLKLCFYTPTTELSICGHASLAAAAVIFNCIGNTNKKLTFETQCGPVFVEKFEDGKFGLVMPSYKVVSLDKDITRLVKIAVGDLPYQDIKYSPDLKRLIIRLNDSVSRAQFESLNPNTDEMVLAHNDGTIVGVALTLKGSAANGCVDENGQVYDFVSRYFGPWVGLPEDPVCGSAHSMLSPYWSAELGKKKLYAFQCSKRQGKLWIDASFAPSLLMKGESYVAVQGTLQLK